MLSKIDKHIQPGFMWIILGRSSSELYAINIPKHWCQHNTYHYPDSNVHGANMRPTWVLSAPDGHHVGPMNLAIRVVTYTATVLLCFLYLFIVFKATSLAHRQSCDRSSASWAFLGPFLLTGMKFDPACIGKCLHYNPWDEINHPFPNFSSWILKIDR